MTVRYATRDDLVRWFGDVPATMRAIVSDVNGELQAIAGLATMRDHVQAFSFYRPGTLASTKARMALWFAQMLRETAGPVFALCSETEPTAPGLLVRMGFTNRGNRVWCYG